MRDAHALWGIRQDSRPLKQQWACLTRVCAAAGKRDGRQHYEPCGDHDRCMDREEEVGELAPRAGRACEGVQHGLDGCVDRALGRDSCGLGRCCIFDPVLCH
jgi:hypothetical protein